MAKATASHIMMIRPKHFGFNPLTADNAFQDSTQKDTDPTEKQKLALAEFEEMVRILQAEGVHVRVMEDSEEPQKPDAIFPNNWVSFHEDGRVFLYPMYAPNRRYERRPDLVESLKSTFQIESIKDLSAYEAQEKYLESTGSMIFDRANQIVYACYSKRTDETLLDLIGKELGYKVLKFKAVDENGKDIYHTNVLMNVGEAYAVICLDAIPDIEERHEVIDALEETDKEIIAITFEQMNNFAGNMLELENQNGDKLLVMSERAFHSLDEEQITQIENYAKIVCIPLETIENNGGGSARCMIAEIFNPLLG
ncbi:MAG: arginine deiminase-related protein [Microscillaceae bacterium]|nr:arginine deiminase-related protein [Microscillaceae bacterium]